METFKISPIKPLCRLSELTIKKLKKLTLSETFMMYRALLEKSPEDVVVTAKYNKKIIGWGMMGFMDDYDKRFLAFYTHPDYRQHGVAHKIMNKLIKAVNDRNNYTLYYVQKLNKMVLPLINNRTIQINTTRLYTYD